MKKKKPPARGRRAWAAAAAACVGRLAVVLGIPGIRCGVLQGPCSGVPVR